MNDGTVKYTNYNGYKAKGMKNKRTKKIEAMRRLEREAKLEAKKQKQKQAYKRKQEVDTNSNW